MMEFKAVLLVIACTLPCVFIAAASGVGNDGAVLSHDFRRVPSSPSMLSYDFNILSLYWPPSVISKPSHGRARHIIAAGIASSGFWCHGLWPARFSGSIPAYCTKESFDARQLGPFETSLAYYLRSPVTTSFSVNLHSFWSHEWARHGTCSNLDQLSYFLTVYAAAMHLDVQGVLAAAHIAPSNDRSYTLEQITSALTTAYGTGFNPVIGLACAPPAVRGGAPVLQEVRLCLSRSGVKLEDCSSLVDAVGSEAGVAPTLITSWAYSSASDDGNKSSNDISTFGFPNDFGERAEVVRLSYGTCGSNPGDSMSFPAYADSDAVAHLPWDIILRVLAVVLLLAVTATAGYSLLQRWRLIPAIFIPRPVVEVRYPPVSEPVRVCMDPLDMVELWDSSPAIAAFVEDLPVGMGIKGGIARKLLKEKYGRMEPAGSFDIDVLLFVQKYSPEARRTAREAVAGCRLGALILEPQDIEVLSKDWLAEYFISRDVTQNEVLILKSAPARAELYYTEQARKDVAADLIRPCVHALKTEFHLVWELEKDGTPYTASQQVVRSLVRYLKGHGNDYAFDRPTWRHYRRVGLTKLELFKVLRPFHHDDQKMQAAVDHLVGIGFLHRRELRRAGGVNMLWGLLLQEVNAQVSRHGGRFVMGTLDSEGVEHWVEGKKASTAARLISEEMRSKRTGFVQSEENVLELGQLTFPQSLIDFIDSGPTFDSAAFFRSSAAAAIHSLESSAICVPAPARPVPEAGSSGGDARDYGNNSDGGIKVSGGGEIARAVVPLPPPSQSGPKPLASICDRSISPELVPIPAGKLRWEAMQSAAVAGGALVYQVMRRVGSEVVLGSPGRHGDSNHGGGSGGAAGGSSSIEEELQREVVRIRTALLPSIGSSSDTCGTHDLPQIASNTSLLAADWDAGASVTRRHNAALKDLIGASFGQTMTTQQLPLSQHDTQYGGDGGGTTLPPQFNNTVGLSPTPPVPAGTVSATVPSTGVPTWSQGGTGGGDGSPHRDDSGPHVPSERYVLPSGASGGDADGSGGMYDTVSYWLRYSSLAGAPADSSGEGLGSFYQASGDTGAGLLGGRYGGGDRAGDEDSLPLIEDHEVQRRRRPSLGKLIMFVIGVMALDKVFLLFAYGMLLCGLVARLCIPRVEAALFDAFNELDLTQFWSNLWLSAGLILSDTLLTLAGRVTLELFTRNAMRQLFRRLFEHVVFQDLPFFARLSPGELMARTSGDSLTLRGIISGTIYRLVEGVALFLGATSFLAASSTHLLTSRPLLVAALLLLAAMDVGEAVVLGMWLRRLNLSVRQAMGRMFGFTLNIFSLVSLVSALGLEPTAVADYTRFAADYFANTFGLNMLIHCHRAATGMLSALLRFSLLALGGVALFDGATTVGTLFALLQYGSWLQQGLKQASDSWASLMAGLGTVERLVELHDRGTFGAVPAGQEGHGSGFEAAAAVAADSQRRLFRENDGRGGGHGATPAAATPSAPRCQPSSRNGDGASLYEPLLASRTTLDEHDETSDLEANATGDVTEKFSSTVVTAGYGSAHSLNGGGGTAVVMSSADSGDASATGLAAPRGLPQSDFGRLLGGFKLSGVHLTSRIHTTRLLLRDASLEVLAGQVAIVYGDDPEGLHGLLSLLLLRTPPYKGTLAFQLPTSTSPYPAVSGTVMAAPSALDRLLRRHTPPAPPFAASSSIAATISAGGPETIPAATTPTVCKTNAVAGSNETTATAARVTAAAGQWQWEWATFSFRHDHLRAPRSRLALMSRSMCGIFRTTLEDNVAVAAAWRNVTTMEVRQVCTAAGLHDEAMSLKDGYFTLLGEGSGSSLSPAGLLRLAVARALLRRPALLVLEDPDAFQEALGEDGLMTLLRKLSDSGCCVVILYGGRSRGGVGRDRWAWADIHVHLQGGTLSHVFPGVH